MAQLGYVVGPKVRNAALLRFFETWKFKHPNPNDFKRIMELESGMELDWYFQYFQNSTAQIDYRIAEVRGGGNSTTVVLERVGRMPMPQDVLVTYTDGTTELYHIPLVMMRAAKPGEHTVLSDWGWVHTTYDLELNRAPSEVASVFIDPTAMCADVNRSNNLYEAPADPFMWRPAGE